MYRLGIAIAIWLGLAGASSAQLSCQKIGQQTYCSNGQVLQRFGNTIYDGKGHAWQELGDRTTSSDGTTYQRSGNQILDKQRQLTTAIWQSDTPFEWNRLSKLR